MAHETILHTPTKIEPAAELSWPDTIYAHFRGAGNCINMFSLLKNCGFGCVIFVTMRGEFGEFNPWQVPMGAITEDVLKLAGFLTYRIAAAEPVARVAGRALGVGVDRP